MSDNEELPRGLKKVCKNLIYENILFLISMKWTILE